MLPYAGRVGRYEGGGLRFPVLVTQSPDLVSPYEGRVERFPDLVARYAALVTRYEAVKLHPTAPFRAAPSGLSEDPAIVGHPRQFPAAAGNVVGSRLLITICK